jgi:hypothetical protein
VAFGQAAGGKPDTFYNSMFNNRFLGVTGTGGVEPAMLSHEWAQQHLVTANKE